MNIIRSSHYQRIQNPEGKGQKLIPSTNINFSNQKFSSSRPLNFATWVPEVLQKEIEGEFIMNNPISRVIPHPKPQDGPEIDMRRTIWPGSSIQNQLESDANTSPALPYKDSFLKGEPLDRVESVGKSSFASSHSTVGDKNQVDTPTTQDPSSHNKSKRIIGFHNYFSSDSAGSGTLGNSGGKTGDDKSLLNNCSVSIILTGNKQLNVDSRQNYQGDLENLSRRLNVCRGGRGGQQGAMGPNAEHKGFEDREDARKSHTIFKSLYVDFES